VIRHRVYTPPWSAPSPHRSHNAHVRIATCGGFDNGYIGRLVAPVRPRGLACCSLARSHLTLPPLSWLEAWVKTYLLVDMLQRAIRVLAVAHTMTPHTGLTGILLALDQHLRLVPSGCRRLVTGWHVRRP